MPLRNNLRACIGGCGRRLMPHRLACVWCLSRVPVEFQGTPEGLIWLRENPTAGDHS